MSENIYNATEDKLTRIAGGTLWADSPIGTILPYGGASAPSGWFLCQGQAISRTTYSELFAVIGESFGAGDGSTTFNLPDMRESVPKGAGLTGHTVGAHLDADGLTVGEFLDDRLQDHRHNAAYQSKSGGTGEIQGGQVYGDDGYMTGYVRSGARTGDTTEVKSVGVNYIIKAKMVAVPSDFLAKVDETLNTNILVSPVQVSAINTQYELNLNAELKSVNKLMVSFYTDINKGSTDIRYYPFIIYLNESYSSAADTMERRDNNQLSVTMHKLTSTKLALTIFAGQLYDQDSYYVDGVYII